MSESDDWLPELVYLSDYEGDFEAYIEAVYSYFKADFVENLTYFEGRKISFKRHPEFKGKEMTFWHVTSEGRVEEERTPDFRRCERIRWIKPIIENANNPEIKVWENQRNKDNRVCFWLESEDYLVVLAKRPNYTMLWTAYLTNFDHTRRKLEKEYQAYKKAGAAQ